MQGDITPDQSSDQSLDPDWNIIRTLYGLHTYVYTYIDTYVGTFPCHYTHTYVRTNVHWIQSPHLFPPSESCSSLVSLESL